MEIPLPNGIQNAFLAALLGKVDGTLDQGQVGIGLGKIAQHPLGLEVQVLAEKSQVVAVAQQALELFQGLFLLPDLEQAVDEPKGAYGEGRAWQSKIILVPIPVQQAIMAETLLHGLYRTDVAGVTGLNEPIGFHEQYRGIQMP